MEHLKDIELIELVAEKLSPERREAALAHLAGCGACTKRMEAQKAAWRALGAWEASPQRRRDLAADVLARAATARPGRIGAGWILLRAAAAVLVAVLIGHGAARWVISEHQPPMHAELEQRAARSLYLDFITNGSATGITEKLAPVLGGTRKEDMQ